MENWKEKIPYMVIKWFHEPVLSVGDELIKFISSELESAKQERTKEILEWIDTQRDADLGDDDIIYISDLISYLKRPLHQNNNEQGGK